MNIDTNTALNKANKATIKELQEILNGTLKNCRIYIDCYPLKTNGKLGKRTIEALAFLYKRAKAIQSAIPTSKIEIEWDVTAVTLDNVNTIIKSMEDRLKSLKDFLQEVEDLGPVIS